VIAHPNALYHNMEALRRRCNDPGFQHLSAWRKPPRVRPGTRPRHVRCHISRSSSLGDCCTLAATWLAGSARARLETNKKKKSNHEH
jgi:hypothetical protein